MAHDKLLRPDCERAFAFRAGTCEDPGCGLHLIAFRSNERPICEMVIGREALRELLAMIHDQGLDL